MLSSSKLYFYGLLVRFLPETRAFELKAAILRWCGATVGKGVKICSSATISGIGVLTIDDDVFIGQQSFISSSASIHIGKLVGIGPQVYIGTGTHEVDPVNLRSCGKGVNKDIVIEEGAWIALRSVLLPGVTVGRKAIVCAGAVVTKSVPERHVVAGIPAATIRVIW